MFVDYEDLDATALAELVRTRTVTPTELVEEAVARVVQHASLNAVVHRQFDRARADALVATSSGEGFPGVPFLLKDFRGREAGEPYRMGNRLLAALDYRPRTDSPVVRRFRGAGLIPIGRTNVPEMALMGTTEPECFGPTRNPWDPTLSPGGSSGGSAAAVAARIVPLAHATDISGSIRIPAAHCGLVGFKPSRWRLATSTSGRNPTGLDTEGVLTRSVRDTAAAMRFLTDAPWQPAPRTTRTTLRIGVWTEAFNGSVVDPENARGASDAAALLEGLGHVVEIAAPAVLSSPELWGDARIALDLCAAREADAWVERIGRAFGEADMESHSWASISAGRSVSGTQAFALLERLQRHHRSSQAWFENYDLLVTPTTAAPPTPLGDYLRAYESGRGSAFTRPLNVTGQPAISLPLGWPADGLPRGVQLVGAFGHDDLLLDVAASLELAAPWSHHRPPPNDSAPDRNDQRRGQPSSATNACTRSTRPARS